MVIKKTGRVIQENDSNPIFSGSDSENPSRFVHMRHRIDRIERLGESHRFPKNRIIIRAGEVPEFCYLVKSGQVVAETETESGNELFFCIMEANSIFGEINMLFEKVLPVTFRTTIPSELVRIEKAVFKEAVKNDSDIAMAVLEGVPISSLRLSMKIKR